MKKITLCLLFVLLVPLTAWGKDQVVMLKKSCYTIDESFYCKGLIKNLSKTDDVKNVKIVFIPQLIGKEKYPAFDFIDYLPADETVPFMIRWEADKNQEDFYIKQVIVTMGLTSEGSETSEYQLVIDITYKPVKP